MKIHMFLYFSQFILVIFSQIRYNAAIINYYFRYKNLFPKVKTSYEKDYFRN